MRVFIVDNEPVYREGLKSIIGSDQDLTTLGEANSTEGLPLTARTADLIILDGELDSLALIKSLQESRTRGRPPFVLVLTKHKEDHHAVQFLRAGADGYLRKSAPPRTVLDAIRKTIRGEKYVPSELSEIMLLALNGVNGPSRLSHREYQVLSLFAAGMGTGEIANQLALSVKTVSTYRSRILDKLNLNTNAQLMRYAFDKGMAA